VVALLLELGVDVDVADEFEQRGLQVAVAGESLEVVKLALGIVISRLNEPPPKVERWTPSPTGLRQDIRPRCESARGELLSVERPAVRLVHHFDPNCHEFDRIDKPIVDVSDWLCASLETGQDLVEVASIAIRCYGAECAAKGLEVAPYGHRRPRWRGGPHMRGWRLSDVTDF